MWKRIRSAGILIFVIACAAPMHQPANALEAPFVLERRATFRAWGARSNLAAAADGQRLYFSENGPDGPVLKSASLDTGAVTIRAKVSGVYYNVAAIPGDPGHLILGEVSGGTIRAFRAVVLDLATGEEKPLDIGEDGGDGRLIVSPSGKYLVTGVDYGCHTGDRDCFANELAVISLATGLQEYRYEVPVTKSKSVEELSGSGPLVEVTRSTPLAVDVAWADDDALVLSSDSNGGSRRSTVLRRRKNGEWAPWKATPRGRATAQPQNLTAFPGQRFMSIARSSDAIPAKVDLSVLFEGDALGRISTLALDDRILVIKESPGKDGWERVEVVGLKWRDAPKTK